MKLFKFLFIYFAFLALYISVVNGLLMSKTPANQFPMLKERMGTILFHSSQAKVDRSTEEHIYCYYPLGTAEYQYRGGEYILKRVSNISDCQNWLGTTIINESPWVSEKQKFFWQDENETPSFDVATSHEKSSTN